MRTDRIEINPQVMSGKPVIRGTRIPVELLVRKLSEGATEVVILTLNDSRPGTKARGAFTVVQPGYIRIRQNPDL